MAKLSLLGDSIMFNNYGPVVEETLQNQFTVFRPDQVTAGSLRIRCAVCMNGRRDWPAAILSTGIMACGIRAICSAMVRLPLLIRMWKPWSGSLGF